jgi:quercetin dioxygenase-like cupin family protein
VSAEDKHRPVRRIVTGHGSDGTARVLRDGAAKNVRNSATPGHFSTLMWCSDKMPVDIAIGEMIEDMGDATLGTCPPVNGTRFVIVEFPPGMETTFHRTETIDYIVVLDGEVEVELDLGRIVHLRRNDVLIQRGTNHRWLNNNDHICRLAIVLIDAKPIGIGNPVPRGVAASQK